MVSRHFVRSFWIPAYAGTTEYVGFAESACSLGIRCLNWIPALRSSVALRSVRLSAGITRKRLERTREYARGEKLGFILAEVFSAKNVRYLKAVALLLRSGIYAYKYPCRPELAVLERRFLSSPPNSRTCPRSRLPSKPLSFLGTRRRK